MTLKSKLEIAIELLEKGAEELSENNIVVAIVLGGAAQQLLRDICLSRNIETTISLLANLADNDIKKLHDIIVETYNKCKHADKEQKDVDVSVEDAQVLLKLALTDLLKINPTPNKKLCSVIKSIKELTE